MFKKGAPEFMLVHLLTMKFKTMDEIGFFKDRVLLTVQYPSNSPNTCVTFCCNKKSTYDLITDRSTSLKG